MSSSGSDGGAPSVPPSFSACPRFGSIWVSQGMIAFAIVGATIAIGLSCAGLSDIPRFRTSREPWALGSSVSLTSGWFFCSGWVASAVMPGLLGLWDILNCDQG